ncbi:MAG: DUF6162 family protein [Halopseudomonas sp.]|uniref:DUF6162 family protein n=1 Tax=Halopseudomonas sp. TaxID=2901191 RepID=UPI00300295A4
MTVQVVRPAGAGHESLYVAMVCALILALAAVVILWHHEAPVEQSIADYQVDARRDLNAAEQGIYADLRVVAEEVPYLTEELGELPDPQQMAEEGFAPFMADMSAQQRGAHHWELVRRGETAAYLGDSDDASVAGSFLMRITAPDQLNQAVWLHAQAPAQVPDSLNDDALIAAGWKQLAIQYDAGVTRHREH